MAVYRLWKPIIQENAMPIAFLMKGKTVVLMPDNQLHQTRSNHKSRTAFVEFCKDADVLVHDTQFRKNDMPHKADWGHSVLDDVFGTGTDSKVKKLVMFHHDPDRSDQNWKKM